MLRVRGSPMYMAPELFNSFLKNVKILNYNPLSSDSYSIFSCIVNLIAPKPFIDLNERA